jgi:hypothetical protein
MTLAFVQTAKAQEYTDVYACQYIGAITSEPLGDSEGHVLRITDASCLVTAGPLSGGISTVRTIWEGDKTGGTLLAGEAVTRKPGGMAVNTLTDGKLEVMISDGKVVGVVSSGHGRYVMAVGSAAAVAGKAFVFNTKTTGPGQYSIEAKRE